MLLFPPKTLPAFFVSSYSPQLPPRQIPPSIIPFKTLSRFLSWRSKTFPGVASCLNPATPELNVELDRLLALLPDEMRTRITTHPQQRELIEVVLDLGRKPLARFPSGDLDLSETPISFQDIQFATSQVGDFAIDNRAGISRTLHRISAIRNRKGEIIGLTCRVGRAITGSADLLRDLVKDGASLLLIGPPGVGKTTIIREIARMLADDYEKRVMIVDTSNEIGGDGDIPHAGIGSARRMQVPVSDMQHRVLIEAVENHMPQVIVIDEIGTKLEAMAASTIAQRGIQLVATAHGITIENLVMNPSLDMLVGGIQSVTLGDEVASRRGGQKTVLERKGPATFQCGVELISKSMLRIHRSLEATVDAILVGRYPNYEVRRMDCQGDSREVDGESLSHMSNDVLYEAASVDSSLIADECFDHIDEFSKFTRKETGERGRPFRMFIYGILKATVIQGIKKLRLEDALELTDDIQEADVLLVSHSKIKKSPGIQAAARSNDIPIYLTKTGSLVQVMKGISFLISKHEDNLKDYELDDGLSDELNDGLNDPEKSDALEEARLAIEQIAIPKGKPVELLPRAPHILSLQIELIQKYRLLWEIIDSNQQARRVRILPLPAMAFRKQKDIVDDDVSYAKFADDEDYVSADGTTNGSTYKVERLPLLPE
ncbi:hypothetical protein V2J09_008775 [Rumex salicifolius]